MVSKKPLTATELVQDIFIMWNSSNLKKIQTPLLQKNPIFAFLLFILIISLKWII